MGKTVCEQNKCTGCMLCVEICPQRAIHIEDNISAYNASIDNNCIECNLCHKLCQKNNPLDLEMPMKWYQGWASDEIIRKASSSGGAAAALSRAFIQNKHGYVCSCTFIKGEFKYSFTDNVDDLKHFSGSKYIKSNPLGVYKKIKELIKDKDVLFIGLPCHVAAVKAYVGEKNADRLYTVDLICHGTPSPKLLRDYLNSHKTNPLNVKTITFRNNTVFGLSIDNKPMVQPGAVDRYLLAFLCGLCYTDNCYECSFAGIRRVGDITIGDSWGTELPIEEQKKGISLVLVQNDKGEELLSKVDMQLFDVDIKKAVSVNDQLREPSKKTAKHDIFFKKYKTGKFDHATFCSLPRKCIRQVIKARLLKFKIIRVE